MEIRVETHGHVVLLTIDNQPRMNAITRAMMADLVRLWDELERGPCRCIVLTGAGERAFSAGADMSGDLSAREEMARMIGRALLKSDPYTKPIVAAVNGVCAGGGVELLRWYGEGKLRPLVSDRLPLERSVEAIRRLTDRQAHGKLVVRPSAR